MSMVLGIIKQWSGDPLLNLCRDMERNFRSNYGVWRFGNKRNTIYDHTFLIMICILFYEESNYVPM